MITSPRSSKAVEALELLAIFPVDVSCIPGPSRNRIRTDSLINAAERSARSIRLDRVALTSAAPYSFFTSTNQLDEFETKRMAIEWASVKSWHTCFTLGDDELYESVDERSFSEDWIRSLAVPAEQEDVDLQASADAAFTETDLFAKKRWSWSRRKGSTALVMRCLATKLLLSAFHAIRQTPIDFPESERLRNLSGILDDYKRRIEALEEEFRVHLPRSSSVTQLLRTTVATEATAGYLLILGTAILRGLGIDKKESVPASELALLVRGENASLEMREFLTKYGEHRILAAEKMLVNMSTICRDAIPGSDPQPSSTAFRNAGDDRSPSAQSKAWVIEGRSRAVLPILNFCATALEAAFNAMEMHATMFKLWKTPPKRSDSWQLVFSNVITKLLLLDPKGSIQNGSIPATCAYILQGMLKVIVAWTQCSRKKDFSRTSSLPAANMARRDNESNLRASPNAITSGQQASRMPAGGSSDISRYSALLQGDVATQRSFDAMYGGYDANSAGSLGRGPASYRGPPQNGPNSYAGEAAPYFDANVPQARYSDIRSSHGHHHQHQPFAPDANESLAAALPRSGGFHDGQPIPSSMHSNYFGPYRAGPAVAGSSGSSSHTQTPPFHEHGHASVAMTDHGSQNGSTGFSNLADANGSNNGDVQPSVALDSLDFILNDVLGSSEWSGILQDIWRTDM